MTRRLLTLLLLLASLPAMAATVTSGVTVANTAGSPNTSASFTPANNDLLVVILHAANSTSNPGAVTSSIGITFTQVSQCDIGVNSSDVHIFVADSLSNGSATTVTWTPGASTNGVLMNVLRVSGMTRTGSSAVRQIGPTSSTCNAVAASSAPSFTFASSVLTGNPTIVGAANVSNTASLTPPTNWTETADLGMNTPTSGLEVATRDSGFTGTTVTWGSTSATDSDSVGIELDASSVPTFTVAPNIDQRTTNSIRVNYTIDTTSTVYSARLTDGSATPTCDALEAQTATGAVQYATPDAATATVNNDFTFGSISDGTVTDIVTCAEDGSSNDSAVNRIENAYKIPAFTTPLTIASQSASAYTSNSKVLDGPGTVTLVACEADASPPSVAQVNAGTGGCIVNSSSDDATGTQTLTITASPAPPLHDLYYTGTYGEQVEAAVNTLADEFLDPPTGKLFQELASIHATSMCFGQTPAVVATDVLVTDEQVSPGNYFVTLFNDCRYTVDAGADTSRQLMDWDVWDKSLGQYYGGAVEAINNLGPIATDWPFSVGSLFAINESPALDADDFVDDPEGDTITYTVTGGALPTDWLMSSGGAFSDGVPGACGPATFQVTATDQYLAATPIASELTIGPRVPNVTNMNEATGSASIEAQCTLVATAGTPRFSGSVALGNIIETDPPAGELVHPDAEIEYFLSLGPPPPGGRGFGFAFSFVD